MSKTTDSMTPQREAAAKTYSRPTLTRFGKVRELTAGGTGAMNENGMGGMMGNSFNDPNRQRP